MESSLNQPLRFSFLQLIGVLVLQIVLLAGAFYTGTRFSGRSFSETQPIVKDQELAKLLPEVTSASPPSSVPEDQNKESISPSAVRSTPFDQSKATMFRIKSSENSEYTLQIASYPDEAAAVKVVEDWKKKGYQAFLSVEEIPDRGKWYRVNVGSFGEEADAESFAKVIQSKEQITAQVVTND